MGSAKKRGKRDGWHPTVLMQGQQEKRKGVSPLKNYGETLFWIEESFKGFVCGSGFKLGGAGSLVADETDAPEVIADPHLLTSSQLISKRASKLE